MSYQNLILGTSSSKPYQDLKVDTLIANDYILENSSNNFFQAAVQNLTLSGETILTNWTIFRGNTDLGSVGHWFDPVSGIFTSEEESIISISLQVEKLNPSVSGDVVVKFHEAISHDTVVTFTGRISTLSNPGGCSFALLGDIPTGIPLYFTLQTENAIGLNAWAVSLTIIQIYKNNEQLMLFSNNIQNSGYKLF